MHQHKFRPYLMGVVSLVVAFSGCGGGGGGSNSLPGNCDTTTFTPNYADISDLRHWPGFPLRVFLGPANQSTIDLTLRGFDQWVTATNGRVDYVLVNNADSADIVVSFDVNDGGSQLGLTTVTFRGNTLEKAEIDFFYLPANQPGAARTNQITAAHEFGHALGLGLHSPNDNDIMAAVTDGTNTTVTNRDLNTLLTAYCNTFPQRLTTNRAAPPSDEPLETFTISHCRQH
jgi:hypothetical protein